MKCAFVKTLEAGGDLTMRFIVSTATVVTVWKRRKFSRFVILLCSFFHLC